MESVILELADHEATRSLGASLAKRFLNKPSLILLSGDLGAGKTTLAQGFISALLPVQQPIGSPSYSYLNVYDNTPIIYHFDLYRINNVQEIEELGLMDNLYDQNALRLVEWPERLPALAHEAQAHIHLANKHNFRVAQLIYFNHS